MQVRSLILLASIFLTAAPVMALAADPPAKAAPNKKAPEPPPPPPDPNARMKTSEEIKRESVEGAATSPLRDFNVVRTKIPNVLLQALSNPYDRPPRNWKCAQLVTLIRPLNEALGPDMDVLPAGDENLMERGRQTALGAAADLASDAIPFRGWVRKLTGAEKHDQLVQSAIVAGNVRRAYLKGLGETRGCTPPATPSHERAGAPPAEDGHPLKPQYPTRQPAAPQTSSGTPPPAPR